MTFRHHLLGMDLEGQEGLEDLYNTETKHGIDKLQVMLKFMSVIDNKSEHKIQTGINSLKAYLVQQLKRGIELEEEEGMIQGILDYIRSEPATTERTEAMDYLFNLKFLKDEV